MSLLPPHFLSHFKYGVIRPQLPVVRTPQNIDSVSRCPPNSSLQFTSKMTSSNSKSHDYGEENEPIVLLSQSAFCRFFCTQEVEVLKQKRKRRRNKDRDFTATFDELWFVAATAKTFGTISSVSFCSLRHEMLRETSSLSLICALTG